MNSQKGIVDCLLLACTLQMPAQVKTYKYRVNFRDKAETTYTLDNPSAYFVRTCFGASHEAEIAR